MLVVGPFADGDEVPLQPVQGVAEGPQGRLVGGAVAGRVITGGVWAGPVGEHLDEGPPEVVARPLLGPPGGGIDRQEVIAIDPQGRQAVAHALGREGRRLAPGYALEGRDGPLVVDHVHDHGGAIDRGEDQGLLEVLLGAGALADPGGGDLGVALVGRGHGPAHRLAELGGDVARQGEEAERLAGVEHRQLAALQGVGLIGVDLIGHVDEGIAPPDQHALLAIGGEAHVVGAQHQLGRRGYGLFPGALDVERGLALAVVEEHPLVKGAGQDHVLQTLAQDVGVQLRVPRADRLVVVVQHPDQAVGQVAHVGGIGVDGRTRRVSGGRQDPVAVVRLVSGAPLGDGDIQAQPRAVGRPVGRRLPGLIVALRLHGASSVFVLSILRMAAGNSFAEAAPFRRSSN